MSPKPPKDAPPAFARLAHALASRAGDTRERALTEAIRLHAETPAALPKRELRLLLRLAQADPDFSVRLKATEELGFHGAPADAFALQDRLRDPEWAIRATAASSLAILLGKRARKPLLRALEDDSPLVRRYAAVGLYDALGEAAAPTLRAWGERERDELAKVGFDAALAWCGDAEALARLRDHAASPFPRVASPARESLRRLDAPQSPNA